MYLLDEWFSLNMRPRDQVQPATVTFRPFARLAYVMTASGPHCTLAPGPLDGGARG
jgi:hypothetical protein